MKGRTRVRGALGEELACQLLRRQGYRILLRNYTCLLGEIDLIARDGSVLVFVEVKSRRSNVAGEPLEAITHHKRVQIIRCAKFYLNRFPHPDVPCRFDAVSVKIDAGGATQVELVQNAFGTEGL